MNSTGPRSKVKGQRSKLEQEEEDGGGGHRRTRTVVGSVGKLARRGEWAKSDQPKRPRSVCRGCSQRSIKVPTRPPRISWEGGRAGPPNKGERHDGESNGKVQGGAG